MTMVVALASNQTMAFYSSTSNSSVQRRDIKCNASNKGKQIKKHRNQHLPNFGHSIESCEQFKNHVFSSLDARRISLQGPAIKKEEVKGTPKAEDTKKCNPKRDDQKLKEKNLELKEKNLELRKENLQLKEEKLGLRGEDRGLRMK
ncbi:uncharacterized protein G2W53_021850 [Senna tora]|uniref:Uncharacterized protein n=1 Tax=Senna tora TaxID=362788 RepID=A0A834TMN2_9FABA|nr:uncharacterized protein G2W53_021850 [Senna tora]